MSKVVLKEDKNFARNNLIIKVLYMLYYSSILYLLFLNLSIECKKRRIQSNDSSKSKRTRKYYNTFNRF